MRHLTGRCTFGIIPSQFELKRASSLGFSRGGGGFSKKNDKKLLSTFF